MARLRTRLPFWSIALGLLLVLAGASGAAAQSTKAKAPAKLDLNTASEADIEAIKGVGPDTAKKIVAGRPYEGTDVAKALEKAGVSKSLIPKIAGNFTVGAGGGAAAATAATGTSGAGAGGSTGASGGAATSKPAAKPAAKPAGGAAAKLDLNSASEADIEAVKGVGAATAKKIVAGRPYEGTDVAKALEKAGVSKSLIPKIAGNFTIAAAGGAAAATGTSAAGAGGGSKSSAAAGGAATTPSAGAGSSTATKSTTATKTASTEEVAARTPPQKGQVWVNTDSGVFHKEGTRWYGKTKEGKWMTEADAVKAGYRAAKNE